MKIRILRKLAVLLVIFFAAKSIALAQGEKVYAMVSTSTYLNLREGPGTEYRVLGKLYDGTKVAVLSLDTYASGWVKVLSPKGIVGYVSAKNLTGDYVAQFRTKYSGTAAKSGKLAEKASGVWGVICSKAAVLWEKIKIIYSKFSAWCMVQLGGLVEFCESLLLKAIGNGWGSLFLVALALVMSAGIVFGIRLLDESFEKPWIHYVLYFVTLLPTWVGFKLSTMFKSELTFLGNLLLLTMTLVPAVLTIHGGWGVRECGMYDGKYDKNFNREIGQLLQFPVWMMLTAVFWNTMLLPLIEFTDVYFTYQGGGFWRFVIGFVVSLAIVVGVLLAWVFFIIPIVFKTAGNWVLYIMSIVLWWAMMKMGWHWAYANFNGLGFVCIVGWSALIFLGCLTTILGVLNEMRCPMCHNCGANETDRTDHGVSYSTSTSWQGASSSSISTRHSGAEVSDARELVRTTIGTHNWTTEHTCPNCGCKWTIGHSEEVSRNSQVLERRWTEHY